MVAGAPEKRSYTGPYLKELAGVLAYGSTRDEASARAESLALRTLAQQIEHGEAWPFA